MSATAKIGHNGGPRVALPRKLSPAQVRALTWIRDYGNSAYGLSGRSQYGGASGTAIWLRRNKLTKFSDGELRDRNDRGARLSERGERVLAAGRLVE